ncbi:hypothetical protein LTR53_019249, partial [Teratosphaeriaceae sp. CCFEE 6253]
RKQAEEAAEHERLLRKLEEMERKLAEQKGGPAECAAKEVSGEAGGHEHAARASPAASAQATK